MQALFKLPVLVMLFVLASILIIVSGRVDAQGIHQQVAQSEVSEPAQDVTGEAVAPNDVILEPAIVMPEGQGNAAPAETAAQAAIENGGVVSSVPGVEDADKLSAEQQALKEIAEQDRGMVTLFFTEWQHTAIREARRSRGLVRPLSQQERNDILNRGVSPEETLQLPPPPPEERNISLGGIVYAADGSWTIWLNGKRVTAKSLPPEVLDLKVYKGYIEMKWVDAYTNQIFPLRLRPHQRFNLDTRIFLPG